MGFKTFAQRTEHTLRLGGRNGQVFFAAKSFFDHFNITQPRGSYVLRHDEEGEKYYIELARPLRNPRRKDNE
jgi:hypothetical protein